jgi:hypothetical protein
VQHDLEVMSAQLQAVHERVTTLEKSSLRDETSASRTRNKIIDALGNVNKSLAAIDTKFDARLDTIEISLRDLEPVRVSARRKEQLNRALHLVWCRLKPLRYWMTLAVTSGYAVINVDWDRIGSWFMG